MARNKGRSILIVAEKARAAEKIAYALSRNGAKPVLEKRKPVKLWVVKRDGLIYRIVGTGGHLYTTEFAKTVHEKAWRDVDPKYLLTRAPLTKIVRKESRTVVNVIREEVKRVKEIIIATDYDREGENIGMQVVDLIAKKINKNVRVRRAIFSSLTIRELRSAIKEENLAKLDRGKIDASEVRQELDLRYGVAFTRLATMKFHQRLGDTGLPLLSIGPCQTPTLGLIVDKYLKHIESKKKAERERKYKIYIVANLNGFKLRFLSTRTYESKGDAIKQLSGVSDELIIEVSEKKEMRIPRPLPLNTPRLAELAARYLKLSPFKTLKLAEKLYLEGLISYPRTETDRYSREVLGSLYKVIDEMKRKKFIARNIEIGNPRQGKRDDYAHPPIHPTKFIDPTKIRKKMGSKGKELYELICRHFVANFMRNAELTKYKIKAIDSNNNEYVAEVVIPREVGFLKIYTYRKIQNLAEEYIADLLENTNKTKLTIISKGVEEKRPDIIKPISESDLVKLMDKLGIGTDATFAEHIKKNIDRGYVVRKEGRLIPTRYGLAVAMALREIVPEVIDPKIRARIEQLFSAVEEGKMTKNEAIKKGISEFVRIYDKFNRNIDKFISKVVKGAEEIGLHQLRKLKRRKKQ